MKLLILKFLVVIFTALQFICCRDFVKTSYNLSLPNVPEAWISLLGEPHWRVEWLDNSGNRQFADISPKRSIAVDIPVTWVNPVTALPYWPEHGLLPGLFYPAGALFPFDVSENTLILTWEAGRDVVFYRNLALSGEQNGAKMPAYFDWTRFRELFTPDILREEVVKDPWLVDWQYVADRTLSANFDRRRLVPQKTENLVISVSEVPWYGMSVFADPLLVQEGEGFPVSPGINVWFSEEGILRVNGKAWVLTGYGTVNR